MKDYILTVYCLAFNHEKYIEKTLKGFVEQITEYPFKVVVHDDASTDSTRKIIQRYAEEYPDIIFPIYQDENQYSQGKGIFENFIKPCVEGKYIAICEGDDYWCDPNKLQKQISYMEQNPDCSLCVHNTEMIDENGKSKNVYFNKSSVEQDYSAEEIIECGGGGLFHTSSFVMRADIRLAQPREFKIKGIGDYTQAMFMALNGAVHYFPDVMSKYRVGSINSWVKKNSSDVEKYKKYVMCAMEDIDKIDEMTAYKYTKSFDIAKKRFWYNYLLKKKKIFFILFNREYRHFFIEKGMKTSAKTVVKLIIGKI